MTYIGAPSTQLNAGGLTTGGYKESAQAVALRLFGDVELAAILLPVLKSLLLRTALAWPSTLAVKNPDCSFVFSVDCTGRQQEADKKC